MFGLMQPDGDCQSTQNSSYRLQRLHYCGTCKTLGKHYGQKSRVLLNYDAVFLAELLTAISGDNPEQWESALLSINKCFTLPKSDKDSPVSLHYAAASNALFAKLKIRDNSKDNAGLWKWAARFFKGNFHKATEDLKNWGLDMEKAYEWAELQEKREAADIATFENFESYIVFCAAPASEITALVFAGAAIALGRPELKDNLKHLGFAFGALVYRLDALEDFEKDLAKKEFNPFLKYFGNSAETERDFGLEALNSDRIKVEEALLALPLTEEFKERIAVRLFSNLSSRTLKIQWKEEINLSLGERLQVRYSNAKDVAARILCEPKGFSGKLQYNLLLWSVFVTPQAAGKNGFSLTAFFLTLLTAAGLGWAIGKLPIKNKSKKGKWRLFGKRKADNSLSNYNGKCGNDSCAECMGIILFFLLILLLIEIGMIIFGIFLVIGGHLFWGIFAMLILPVLLLILWAIIGINKKVKSKKRVKQQN